jgi:hypothetical protein
MGGLGRGRKGDIRDEKTAREGPPPSPRHFCGEGKSCLQGLDRSRQLLSQQWRVEEATLTARRTMLPLS